jgi:flagellar export protein FliJ
MRRFQFRLQAVLSLREMEEKQARQDLARAASAWRDALARQTAAVQRRIDVLETLTGHVDKGSLDLALIELHHREVARLDRVEILARREEEQARRRLDEAKASLAIRRRDLKAFESLREHDRDDHQVLARREEQLLMDEIASTRRRRET